MLQKFDLKVKLNKEILVSIEYKDVVVRSIKEDFIC